MSVDDLSVDATSGAEPPDDRLLALWQAQPAAAAPLGDEALRVRAAHADRAYRRLRLLRVAQTLGTVLGIAVSIVAVVRAADPLMRVGAALLALTLAFQWIVGRTMPPTEANGPAGAQVSAEPSLVAYRAALVLRLGEDRGLRLWWRLAVGGPAAALFLYGFARAYPSRRTMIAAEAVAIAAGLAITFASTVRRARRFQAELDALDALEISDDRGAHPHPCT